MTSDERQRRALELLNTGGWGGLENEDISPSEANELSDYLTSLSVTAGMLAQYLGYRGGFGCGDHGHDKAMKAAHKREKALRKANGYSYP